ncbi:MAG TPA: ThuA domain-containing protein [Pirellulales bacterium]|jgi:hypothetical protein
MLKRFAFALVVALGIGQVGYAGEKKQLLLIGQKRDNHPVTTHEFMPGLRVLAATLQKCDDLEVRTVQAEEPWAEGPDLIRRADGIVIYVSEGAKWIAADPRRQGAIAQLASRGGGLTALHWGIGAKDPQFVGPFTQLFGGCHGGPDRRYQVLETQLSPAEPRHAIAQGLTPLTVHDEFYYRLKRPTGDSQPQPVLTAKIDGQDEMVALAWQRPDGGRSFGFTGLHFHENWKQEFYRRLVTQGVMWTMKLEIPAAGVNIDVPETIFALPNN